MVEGLIGLHCNLLWMQPQDYPTLQVSFCVFFLFPPGVTFLPTRAEQQSRISEKWGCAVGGGEVGVFCRHSHHHCLLPLSLQCPSVISLLFVYVLPRLLLLFLPSKILLPPWFFPQYHLQALAPPLPTHTHTLYFVFLHSCHSWSLTTAKMSTLTP